MTAQPVALAIPRWLILIGIAVHILAAIAVIIAHTTGIHHSTPADAEALHDTTELRR